MMQQFDITSMDVRGYPDYLIMNLETLKWYSPGGIVTWQENNKKNSHANSFIDTFNDEEWLPTK
jgi:hypothetical protein